MNERKENIFYYSLAVSESVNSNTCSSVDFLLHQRMDLRRRSHVIMAIPIFLLITVSMLFQSAAASADHFVYVGCTLLKFPPESPYRSSLDSILTSLVNSAAATPSSPFNKFMASATVPVDTAYGLYQCRGDLTPPTCARCVARAVSLVGGLCAGSCGGALQLDGCFVKYDNMSFFGVADRTTVYEKCEESRDMGPESGARLSAVLSYVKGEGGGKEEEGFRAGGSGLVKGMAQCVGDLTPADCQECVSDAVEKLQDRCRGFAAAGDVFLGKCYARYWEAEASRGGNGARHHARTLTFVLFTSAISLLSL